MLHALIHLAQEVGTREGAVRNAQGERPVVAYEGPTIPARLTTRAVSPEQRQDDGRSRTARSWELLLWHTANDETIVDVQPSMTFRVTAPVVFPDGPKVLEVAGDPELLNDGEQRIGWLCDVIEVKDAR